MQKTDFPFEVVIGDDFSTDGTREIVLQYAQEYPDLIQLVISDSNVGPYENVKRIARAGRGKFFASCEGDDYWIDPYKLQKQYDASLKYDASLVTHSSLISHYRKDGSIEYYVRQPQMESGFLDIEDIILKKKDFHTSSIFMRGDVLEALPDWYWTAPTGDYPLKMISASKGNVYYINEVMSVYHKETEGSWTKKIADSDLVTDPRRIEFERGSIQLLTDFNKYTDNRYSETIHERIQHRLLIYLIKFNNLDFLDIPDDQKRRIRRISTLMKVFPEVIRIKVLRKLTEQAAAIQENGNS